MSSSQASEELAFQIKIFIKTKLLLGELSQNGSDKACLIEQLAPNLQQMDPPMFLENSLTEHQIMFSVLEHLNQVHAILMKRCKELSFGLQPGGVPIDAEDDEATRHFYLYGDLRAHDPELLQGKEGIRDAETDLDILTSICRSFEYE